VTSSSSCDVAVLGAGIVGVASALHLQMRGRDVVLVERGEPGGETSYGNAGLIEMSAAFPHPCPQDVPTLLRYALNRSPDVRYDPSHLPRIGARLFAYWRNSRKDRIGKIGCSFRSLVAHSLREHEALIARANRSDLVRRGGWLELIADQTGVDAAPQRIVEMATFGISATALSAEELAHLEPSLRGRFVGAIHWSDTVGITDPAEYVAALARLFTANGGRLEKLSVRSLAEAPEGWTLDGGTMRLEASQVVVALGPWSPDLLAPLGYRIPMIPKRGYHVNYSLRDGAVLTHPVHIPGSGFLLTPMRRGVRLTTGVELAARDSPPDTRQLDQAEARARLLLPLDERLDERPWLGARPCMPDMLPLIGPATRHKNLWFAFGHGHHGLTLGPVTGRLIAEMMNGETTLVDPTPFDPGRYAG
jgi:D-amino-acid dehydrogenase